MSRSRRLNKTKSFSALYGLKELKFQLFLRSVLRQVKEVEAGVSYWQEVGVVGPLYDYLHTGHPSDWYPVAPREKEEKFPLVSLTEIVENLPEILIV